MYNDPLPHFPFAFDFNDVNCQKAAGIPFGDPYLNDVDGSVCFDGEDDYLVVMYFIFSNMVQCVTTYDTRYRKNISISYSAVSDLLTLHFQLGFLNNFFAMNQPDSVTVSFWFNQTGEGFMNDLEGLFGNGDCNQVRITFYIIIIQFST